MKNKKAVVLLKAAFLVGAITDALAAVPMILPEMGKTMWGFNDMQGVYFFAMGFGAALMLGWTILLIWAYIKPLERRYIALFTLFIIAGFIVVEAVSAACGIIGIGYIIPSLIMQVLLTALFICAFVISGKIKGSIT
jgi:hypothetical protein